jgi:lipopolysaccharide transport system permease protein
MSAPATEVEIVVEPTRGFRFTPWRELYAYRDLLWLMVWRDIVARYKQTVLGPLWFIVQPILTTVVFTIVFDRMAGIKTAGVPPTLFYLCGLLPWGYFAQTFQSTSASLVQNASLFGKVYFPRLIVPLSAVISNLAAFFLQLASFAVFFIIYKFTAAGSSFSLERSAALLPLVLLQVAALSFGVGLWLAAITVRFRDFAVLATFLVQLWMYATPIIYPLVNVPARYQLLAALNPMTMPVESFRHMLLGAPSPDPRFYALSVFTTLVALITGMAAFQRAEKNFVDVL